MRELCQAERPASTAGEEPSRLEGFVRTNHPADRIDTGTPESTLALRRVLPTPKQRAGMHTHALCTIITS